MSPHRASSLRRACSLVAGLALAACRPDTASGPFAPVAPALSSVSVETPFHGTLEATKTSFTPLGPTTALFGSAGSGTATHLGRYTVAISLTVDFATLTGTEQLALTAANGDMLYATATTRGSPSADGLTLNVVETATITGGTGRFAGATGTYVVRCVVDQATGTSTGAFEGTIVLVN